MCCPLNDVLAHRDSKTDKNNSLNWQYLEELLFQDQSQSNQVTLETLERLSEEMHCPFDIFNSILKKVDGDDIMSQVVFLRCIESIWKAVLTQSSSEMCFSTEVTTEATSELLAIRKTEDFKSNQKFYNAFLKTQRILKVFKPNSTTLQTLIEYRQAPFLILLEHRLDPSCLRTRNLWEGVALHEALKPDNIFLRPLNWVQWNEENPSANTEDRNLLKLLNQTSPVQLLCHLDPETCLLKDIYGRTPKDSFLQELGELDQTPQIFENERIISSVLRDVKAVARLTPQVSAKDSASFCTPFAGTCAKDDASEDFRASLSFLLLKDDPTVMCSSSFSSWQFGSSLCVQENKQPTSYRKKKESGGKTIRGIKWMRLVTPCRLRWGVA